MFYKLRLNKNIKYSFSLLALLLLTPMDINAELTEDQKSLFDILIIRISQSNVLLRIIYF